jgi:hypothetical protein
MTRQGNFDYAEWIKRDPPPDLQQLVTKHGGYDKITPAAWAEYDRAVAAWQQRRKDRLVGGKDS